MIISKKLKKKFFIEKIFKLLNKIIFTTGAFFLLILITVLIYYHQSGFSYSNPPKILFKKVNEKILVNYLGFDLKKIDEYVKLTFINFLSNFQSSDLDKVFIKINQKSILGLEMQRKIRKENSGEIPRDLLNTFPAEIKYKKKTYNIKIRTKGVRNVHWINKDTTSYKIDLIGSDRIWGLEEFSVQKPITRNYTYEYLFHELLGYVGLTKINYFFINLYLNDQNLGVYAVEEGFSKELVERQQLRNGPIFGISEEFGEYYPNVRYELYSEKYWVTKYPDMSSKIFSILNDIKENKFHVNDHLNLDKWAKYFAIIDLTGTYHGSLAKSVKKYYNPTTALFEPIGYDLHKGAGNFDNFILLDFLQENKPNCIYLCAHKDWYLKFFLDKKDRLNFDFLDLYIKYLKEYSNEDFVKKFYKKFENQIQRYNKEIYKDNSKTDKISRVGVGYFIYDDKYLYKRAKLIKSRISSATLDSVTISKQKNILKYEDYEISNFPMKAETIECNLLDENEKFYLSGKMQINFNSSCSKLKIEDHKGNTKIYNLIDNILLSSNKNIDLKKNFKKLRNNNSVKKISKEEYIVNKDLNIYDNTLLNKNSKFNINDGKKINILNNATLLIEGEIFFNNNLNSQTLIYSEDGTGAIIFQNNKFKLENIIFKNLSSPKLDNLILYGGVNFINTDLVIKDSKIIDSRNEDGMNIINSKSNLTNIVFENIFSDALDIDFGVSHFENIKCYNIKNDCLDISGANVTGKNFYTFDSKDKGISVGENSTVSIDKLKIIKNKIALAVKDGSDANFKNIYFKDNIYDIALFNKKKEFNKPSLFLNNVKNLNDKKILQSQNTVLKINNINYQGSDNDSKINRIVYGE